LAVNPQLAIWSAGKDNTYGHPSPETIDRLKSLRIKTLGTEDEGTIVVATDGKTFHVENYAPQFRPTATPTKTPKASPTATKTPTPATTAAAGSPTPTRTRRPTATPTAVTQGCQPGQVNINTASVDDLQKITQIGPTRAEQMLELRPFTSIDDMDRITGVGIATIVKIKAQGLACTD
jgi:competence protein ComEC